MNGLDLLKTRINYRGGAAQQARMIKDKRETLDRALLYSYQGNDIRFVDREGIYRALINPSQLTLDYDQKTLSIGFESGVAAGQVFEWVDTNTKWIAYLQDLTEKAYFRGEIRKCLYEIAWKDQEDEIQTCYAAVNGPDGTKIKSLQKAGFNMDLPNYTLSLLLPNTQATREYFTRYAKFYLKNMDDSICWRVESVYPNNIPGLLEIYATEHYSNRDEDDIENGIVDGKIPAVPIEPEMGIVGESKIMPRKTYIYKYEGVQEASWFYDKTLPIEVKVNDKEITIKWLRNYSGRIELGYGDERRTITVESLI